MLMSNATILVVDDQPVNLELMVAYLDSIGLESVTASDGMQAWDILKQSPGRFSAVLLDRMMPGMDGIEVLKKIKADPELDMLPVIMQTAMVARKDILDGLQAGAYYYLTKPYDQDHLLAIVQTAVSDSQRYSQLQENTRDATRTLRMMEQGEFTFRTLEEGRCLATLLANACPDANRAVLGLTELMINAVEHGNLGITYEEKSRLNASGTWEQEVKSRLEDHHYMDRHARVSFKRDGDALHFRITDQGDGFDWHEYIDVSPDRAFDSHGRGIAMAKNVSFDRVRYCGKGNEVEVSVNIAR